jgi:hypothetical protein
MSEQGVPSGVVAPVPGRIRWKRNRCGAAKDGGYSNLGRWTFFP